MKRLLIIGSLIIIGSVGALVPKKAVCVNCPYGEKCFGDFNCNQFSCNLRCQAIDLYGVNKICR